MPLRTILNILFPPRCTFCKREGDFLCNECTKKLKNSKIKNLKKTYNKVNEFDYLDGVIYALDYEKNPAIQFALKQFKYKYTKDLSELFGKLLSSKLTELEMLKGKSIELVPVPLHKKRLAERGFNQALLLSEALEKNFNKPIEIKEKLKRTRYTTQQAKLKRDERLLNLKNAFSCTEVLYENNNLLFVVDDVFTTGATLENCAKTLKENGAEKVYGLVVARAFK